MDRHGIQCGRDVYRTFLGVSRRPARRAPCSLGLRLRLYLGKPGASPGSESSRDDRFPGPRRTDGGNLLSTDALLCAAQFTHALCVAGHRDVRDGYRLHNELRDLTGSLLHGPLVLALDFLEWRFVDPHHDDAGLLRYSMAAIACVETGTTQAELARISLRQPGLRAALYRPRSGATTGLAALRNDCGIDCSRPFPAGNDRCPPSARAKSAHKF